MFVKRVPANPGLDQMPVTGFFEIENWKRWMETEGTAEVIREVQRRWRTMSKDQQLMHFPFGAIMRRESGSQVPS
jgi:hypothetical protein